MAKVAKERCSIKKVDLKNFAIFKGKHLYWSLFLIKLQAFRPVNIAKYFAVNIAKFLRAPMWKNICERLLLYRVSRLEVFCKYYVLKKFTEKYLCQSFFFRTDLVADQTLLWVSNQKICWLQRISCILRITIKNQPYSKYFFIFYKLLQF